MRLLLIEVLKLSFTEINQLKLDELMYYHAQAVEQASKMEEYAKRK